MNPAVRKFDAVVVGAGGSGLRLVLYVITIGALVCYVAWSIQIMWGLDAVAGPKF